MSVEISQEKTNFRDVKTEILRRIMEGPWGPGSLLPGEVELSEEFGCSRTTMNRALRELSELGLIDRRRKAGTRVRMAPLREARFEMPIMRVEIEKTGATYRYALVSRSVSEAPEWLRVKLGLDPKTTLVHLICLHFANGAPFQLEDRWINVAALPHALEQDFTMVGPNEWLVKTVPFSDVEISFLAVAASADAVTYLDHNLGEPVFTIERTTWWKGVAITYVTLSHRRGHRMTTRY